ncbi:hypothetical protein AAIH32_08635, partial [Pseudarthrobacter oxydans]|uniref:hypothetical protein n=1 Tax=Pseudarthrobacter oxydans TaxID=1671 RepID=UPI003D2C1DF9
MFRRKIASTSTSFCTMIITVAICVGFLWTGRANASEADTTPPVLVSTSVAPTSANLADGPANITTRMHITDATGTKAPIMKLRHANTGQEQGLGFPSLVSGTGQDGMWAHEATIPEGAASGTWYVFMGSLEDSLGNSTRTGYQTIGSVTTTGPAADTTPPVLVSTSVAPTSANLADGPAN